MRRSSFFNREDKGGDDAWENLCGPNAAQYGRKEINSVLTNDVIVNTYQCDECVASEDAENSATGNEALTLKGGTHSDENRSQIESVKRILPPHAMS